MSVTALYLHHMQFTLTQYFDRLHDSLTATIRQDNWSKINAKNLRGSILNPNRLLYGEKSSEFFHEWATFSVPIIKAKIPSEYRQTSIGKVPPTRFNDIH